MLAETVLAMSGDAIFRYADGVWTRSRIDEPLAFPQRLIGLTYSDRDTAWAFGNERTMLVSRDDGRSWQPAVDRLPEPYVRFVEADRENQGYVRDLLFSSPRTAWLFALRRYAGSAALQTFPVFVSTNEGETWDVAPGPDDPGFADFPGSNVFGVRDGVPEILRERVGSDLSTVDALVAPFARDEIAVPGLRARIFVTSADRGWVGGFAAVNGELSLVVASGRKGSRWSVQDIGVAGDVRLAGMDVRDGIQGLACGSVTESGIETPFCVFTSDGGESWGLGELPRDVGSVGAPVRTEGDTGIVVAGTSDDGIVFLQTTDDGRSFHRGAPAPDEFRGVTTFARSSRLDELPAAP